MDGSIKIWMGQSRAGALLEIGLGVVGAVVGAWLFGLFGAGGVNGLSLYSLLVSR
jgi:uncharacterized membrane protein YeaQ/YmgE (transglycosylase-associated protein family)